ncbi:hypothetical protein [Spirosoma agri]|uniref:Uncharacterized protein n=1 Tax=Spirosoma agri TaxID=1987381 RepID=A0A6M0IFP2_9BACT|nr:hypothetical protein [Spirosoma agri]NEU67096.1 hypothetical protein [Spirosoma agri]
MNPQDRTTAIPALPNQGGQANVPGIRKLWLIEARHLLGVIDPRTVPLGLENGWTLRKNGLQLGEDAKIHVFSFPTDRGSYDQKASVTIQGVVYNQSLAMTVPNDHQLTALVMQRMTGRQWVAIYQDGNGNQKVVGTAKQPLRFLANYQASPSGYFFSWSCQTRQPAYFFSDFPLLDTLQLDAEFSYGFSYDFFS